MTIFTRNLKKGTKGEDVKALQELLNSCNFNCGKVDGIFGSKTLKAVKMAQKANKLTVDGIAGKKTITALGGQWGYTTKEEKLENTLIVCSFNIKRGTYKKGSYNIIGNIINDADIIGIQEVTPTGLTKIATAAGKTSHMCETISNYGTAVLTNFKEDDEDTIVLKGSGERRKLHHFIFDDVSYYNTHFHYTESANNIQLNQLIEVLKKDKNKTIIVTGDFNRQDYPSLIALGFKQVNTGQSINNTDGSSSIVNKIDQIFVKGAEVKRIWKYEAVKKQYSDHDALFAEIKR